MKIIGRHHPRGAILFNTNLVVLLRVVAGLGLYTKTVRGVGATVPFVGSTVLVPSPCGRPTDSIVDVLQI